jgi:hypothetical protein
MTQKTYSFMLSILLFQEDTTWIAQCLQYDIAAQGKTLDDALNSFEKTFVGQLILDIEQDKNPLENTPQTPKEYWTKFEQAKKLEERKPFYLPEELSPASIMASAQDLRIAA